MARKREREILQLRRNPKTNELVLLIAEKNYCEICGTLSLKGLTFTESSGRYFVCNRCLKLKK